MEAGMTEEFDRYVSFRGSDWEGKTGRVLARLQPHIDRVNSPFWAYFIRQRDLAHRQGLDDLRVLHNFVATLRELLENLGDLETLAMLEDLEETCM
jgi:N(2)-fixation sustaining protein CowN